MPIEVFDFRRDVRNVVILPTIRGRFLRMEPGEVGPRHSHDLGDEVFLILEGMCEFEIEGERAVLGPGQLCVARANQLHEVRVVGDKPMTMYLSVTPHIEPTHTFWDEHGQKLPPVYAFTTRVERAARTEPGEPVADLAERFLGAARALAEAAAEHASAQAGSASALRAKVEAGDYPAAKQHLDAMWAILAKLYGPLRALEATWNELAARVAEDARET